MIDLSTLVVDGIDRNDYPDMCDAFAAYAEHTDGTPLTDEELEVFTDENQEHIGEMAREQCYGG